MNDTTTTLTDDQLADHLLAACWFRNLTQDELGGQRGGWGSLGPIREKLSPRELAWLAANIGLTDDELRRAIDCARDRASRCELALAGDAHPAYSLGRRGVSMCDLREPPTDA